MTTYKTPAEVLQTEMNDTDVFAWTNYAAEATRFTAPTVKVRGLEPISGAPPEESILLINKSEKPIFAFNNVKIARMDNKVDVEIYMPTSAKRKAIMDDIDAGLLLTSYNMSYDITDYPDAVNLFVTKLTFTIEII